jgi:hypothetical protein
MPKPLVRRVPLKKGPTFTRCRTVVYYGEVNALPVDGGFRSIAVTDHSASICPRPMIDPPADTTVVYVLKQYDRRKGELIESTSQLLGGKLAPAPGQ